MKLAELVAQETQQPLDAVMLLRHASDSVADLHRFGATIEEFTALQPVESKYDFFHPKMPRISVVVVIVNDRVYGVYKVDGVDAEGTYHELGGDAYKKFNDKRIHKNKETKRAKSHCRRFLLRSVPSVAVDLPVQGWARRERALVQRQGGGFFGEVEVDSPGDENLKEVIERRFEGRVAASLRDSSAARLMRLAKAPRLAPRVQVSAFLFARNPDVVAEILARADGTCQRCGSPAPFKRRSDGTPYLEVHHRRPLAEGGEDVIENAIALCPNCHRGAHFGPPAAGTTQP